MSTLKLTNWQLRSLTLQALQLAKTTRDEVKQRMDGKNSYHKLSAECLEDYTSWIVHLLGGYVYTLFDEIGFPRYAGGADIEHAMHGIKPMLGARTIVAWHRKQPGHELISAELLRQACVLDHGKYAEALRLADIRCYGKKPTTAIVDELDEGAYVGAYTQKITPAVDSGMANHVLLGKPAAVIRTVVMHVELHADAHVLSSMQLLDTKPDPQDEGKPYWIIERQTPDQPAQSRHAIQQVAPLPNAWGR